MTADVDRARQSRMLFRGARAGVLSSHSAKLSGFPYGSALPLVTDHSGRPVLLISHLAEHTRNLVADNRASFVVFDSVDDVQAAARATLVGHAEQISEPGAVAVRYLRFFPHHAQYLEIGGFAFWRIEPQQIRFIEGFGSLHWIAGSRYVEDEAAWADLEASIIEHMNADHRDAILAYCEHVYDIRPQQAEMIGFDCDGFDVRADKRLLRFQLPQIVHTADEARAALIALARESRA